MKLPMRAKQLQIFRKVLFIATEPEDRNIVAHVALAWGFRGGENKKTEGFCVEVYVKWGKHVQWSQSFLIIIHRKISVIGVVGR